MSKWIQQAIKNKGSFKKWCQKRGFKKVSPECIQQAINYARQHHNQRLLRRALLARTLLRLRKK